jgi:hypothetical protein
MIGNKLTPNKFGAYLQNKKCVFSHVYASDYFRVKDFSSHDILYTQWSKFENFYIF